MLIQELKSNGKPRNVPPLEVSEEFWKKLQASKVGAKRYKKVKQSVKDTKNNSNEGK